MVFFGWPFDAAIPRAIARLAAFVIPAIWLLRSLRKDAPAYFGLATNVRWGLGVGVAVSLAWAVLHCLQQFDVPWTTHAWLNIIIGSPIAEEILFRVAMISYLQTKTNTINAILISSVRFALIHLPWWIISGEKTFAQSASTLAVLFVYGVVFALYRSTQSIRASLIPHWVNNLIAVPIVN